MRTILSFHTVDGPNERISAGEFLKKFLGKSEVHWKFRYMLGDFSERICQIVQTVLSIEIDQAAAVIHFGMVRVNADLVVVGDVQSILDQGIKNWDSPCIYISSNHIDGYIILPFEFFLMDDIDLKGFIQEKMEMILKKGSHTHWMGLPQEQVEALLRLQKQKFETLLQEEEENSDRWHEIRATIQELYDQLREVSFHYQILQAITVDTFGKHEPPGISE